MLRWQEDCVEKIAVALCVVLLLLRRRHDDDDDDDDDDNAVFDWQIVFGCTLLLLLLLLLYVILFHYCNRFFTSISIFHTCSEIHRLQAIDPHRRTRSVKSNGGRRQMEYEYGETKKIAVRYGTKTLDENLEVSKSMMALDWADCWRDGWIVQFSIWE